MTVIDPPHRIFGPFDSDGNDVTGDYVALWNVSESRAEVKADMDVSSVPGMESDEAILGGFLGKEEFSFSGEATGNRLSGGTVSGGGGRNNLLSEPIPALKNYAIRLESLVTDRQGLGYRFEDRQREEDLIPPDDGIMVESVSWTREASEPDDLQWSVDATRAKGTGGQRVRSRDAFLDDAKRRWVVDDSGREGLIPRFVPHDIPFHPDYRDEQSRGEIIFFGSGTGDVGSGEVFDLGTVSQKRFERKVPLNVTELALADPGDNLGLPTEAPQVNINLEGYVTPQHLFHWSYVNNESDAYDEMNLFSRYIANNWVGTNVEISYIDSFTDRVFTGQVETFSTTWESGTDIKLNYNIEIQVGDTLSGETA